MASDINQGMIMSHTVQLRAIETRAHVSMNAPFILSSSCSFFKIIFACSHFNSSRMLGCLSCFQFFHCSLGICWPIGPHERQKAECDSHLQSHIQNLQQQKWHGDFISLTVYHS